MVWMNPEMGNLCSKSRRTSSESSSSAGKKHSQNSHERVSLVNDRDENAKDEALPKGRDTEPKNVNISETVEKSSNQDHVVLEAKPETSGIKADRTKPVHNDHKQEDTKNVEPGICTLLLFVTCPVG